MAHRLLVFILLLAAPISSARAQQSADQKQDTPDYSLAIITSDKGKIVSPINVKIVVDGIEREQEIVSPYQLKIEENQFLAEINGVHVDSIIVVLKSMDMEVGRYQGEKICIKVDGRESSLAECDA